MKGATMTIKEMCEYSNIEYNKDHPKRSLNKLCQIYEIEKIDARNYNIIRELSEEEKVKCRKITKCKELLEKTICVQLSFCENNTIRSDMKGFLELFNIVNKKYRYFAYSNMNDVKGNILKDFADPVAENLTLCCFVDDVNPILYRLVREVFNNLEKQMLLYKKEHLMFATTQKYDTSNGNDYVEFTKKWEATNDEIETYMKYYRQFALEMGYNNIELVKSHDKKKIKSMVCREMGVGWAYFEYELILNRDGLNWAINNNDELKDLKLSLNANVVHKISNSNQSNLKIIKSDDKINMTNFLIKN